MVSIIYVGGVLLLIGLFPFGKEILGQKNWYKFGSFTMQPVEFAKIGTALMLANYVAGPDFNIKIRNPCGQLLQLLRFLQLLFLQFRMWDLFWYLVHFYCIIS